MKKASVFWCVWLLGALAMMAKAQSGDGATLLVRDGTPVLLRFMKTECPVAMQVLRAGCEKGHVIRMAVVADVKVGDKVVIAKGALAEGTVETPSVSEVKFGLVTPITATPLKIRLEAVESVNEVAVPLKARKDDKGTENFFFYIEREKEGPTEIVPTPKKKVSSKLFSDKGWTIPAGAWIVAYVDGDVALRTVEVDFSNGGRPAPNETAMVTFIRGRDGPAESVEVVCDGRAVAKFAQRQFASATMAPGKHSCTAGPARVEFETEMNSEYYVRVMTKEMKLINTAEAEDRMAYAEAVRN